MKNRKEYPVVWPADEVNAALAGDKTQHRIILSSQPYINDRGWQVLEIGSVRISDQCVQTRPLDEAIKKRLPKTTAAPYGIGDRLWVQEDHARTETEVFFTKPHYFADGSLTLDLRHDAGLLTKYTANYMPRWASRLLLEVTDIRVERVQDTSHDDAVAEGVHHFDIEARLRDQALSVAQIVFSRYWDNNHQDGFENWESNPWVWVIEFKVIEPSEVNK